MTRAPFLGGQRRESAQSAGGENKLEHQKCSYGRIRCRARQGSGGLADLLPEATSLPDAALIAAALAEMNHARGVGEGLRPSPTEADGDAYTPWSRGDGFRIGTT